MAVNPRLLSVVPRAYLPWLRGGLELTARSVLASMAGLPAETHLAAGMPPESRSLPARVVRTLRGPYAREYLIDRHRVYADLYHPTDLERLVSRLGPDAVICHVAGDNPHVQKVVGLDLPTLFYVHGARLGDVFDGVENMKRVRFAAESRFICERVSAHTAQAAARIRPILDPQRYRIDTAGDAVLVVNPHPLKGGDRVVEMATELPHRHFLVVGGWASTRNEQDVLRIEQSLVALENVERIEYVDDMRDVFRRSRCLLMPCVVEEAYGRAAAEALIAGLPVLASNRGALPETVGQGGVTLSPDAPLQDWLTQLEAMFADKDYYRTLSTRALSQAAAEDRQPRVVVEALRQLVVGLLR